jgi:predicted ester cyclase
MSATAVSTQSIDLVHQFMDDVLVNHEYDRIGDLHEDFVRHDLVSGMEVHGHDEFEAMRRMFDGAFSDLERTNVLSFASDDGEYVCTVDTYRDTHDGELMGIAPTGASVEVQGVVMVRIENGQIAEMWNLMNFLGLLQQIGVVPSLDELAASSSSGGK